MFILSGMFRVRNNTRRTSVVPSLSPATTRPRKVTLPVAPPPCGWEGVPTVRCELTEIRVSGEHYLRILTNLENPEYSKFLRA